MKRAQRSPKRRTPKAKRSPSPLPPLPSKEQIVHRLGEWQEWSSKFDDLLHAAQNQYVTDHINAEIKEYAKEGTARRLVRAQDRNEWVKVHGLGIDPIPATGSVMCVMGHKVGRSNGLENGESSDDDHTDERTTFVRLKGTRALLLCNHCYKKSLWLFEHMEDSIAASFEKDKKETWPPPARFVITFED